jgi:nucleoside-diphosphate-sugar epimerase
MQTISIIGCGWYGLPLAESLLADGHQVKGSTTTLRKMKVLTTKGIEAFLILPSMEQYCITEKEMPFFDSDLLILNIPPRIREASDENLYLERLSFLKNKIQASPIQRIIFISTTSVYPPTGVFTEDQTLNETPFLAAERLFQDPKWETAVLRFGGLFGYDRIPATYLAGKKNILGGKHPVNWLHREDAIGITKQLVNQGIGNQILNVCSPLHPSREEAFRHNATELKMEIPLFDPKDRSEGKLISTDKLQKVLNYSFHFENPLDFTYDLAV